MDRVRDRGLVMSFVWMSSANYLAQMCHFLGGAGLLVTAGFFALACRAGWEPVWITFGLGVAAASAKEFIFDVAPEPDGEGDSWKDSLLDWTFYMIGGGVGLGLVAWIVWIARHHGIPFG